MKLCTSRDRDFVVQNRIQLCNINFVDFLDIISMFTLGELVSIRSPRAHTSEYINWHGSEDRKIRRVVGAVRASQ